MESYELTLVIPGGVTPAKKKSTSDLVEKMVNTFKGKVVKTNDWGKIDLAYPINKNSAGIFMHFILQLDPKGAKDLEQKIRLEEGIIRHLLVESDK